MTDYPEWLVDRVAKTTHSRRVEADGYGMPWEDLPDWAQGMYQDEARAVLNTLGFHQATTPQNWESTLQREGTLLP